MDFYFSALFVSAVLLSFRETLFERDGNSSFRQLIIVLVPSLESFILVPAHSGQGMEM